MPNSPKAGFNEIDLTFAVANAPVGISGVMLRTKRGPYNDPNTLVSTWGQFVKLYGGFMPGITNGPLLAKRAFDRGSKLRVSRIGHYTDITDPDSLDADFAAAINSTVLTLSAPLTAGTMSITVVINGTSISQAYTTSMAVTWAALADKILTNATTKGLVSKAFGASNLVFVIAPKGGAALTVTSSLTGAGAITVTPTTIDTFDNAFSGTPVTLFAVTPKYPGADYNNLVISVLPASNGNASYFNLRVDHLLEPSIFELYENLIIPGNPTVSDSHYLDKPIQQSMLAAFTYNDLSSTTGQQRPVNVAIKYAGGTDGSTLTDSDYIGDSASHTGLQSFNGVDDIYEIASLDNFSRPLAIAGAAYAANRRDVQYFIHLDNSFNNENALAAERDATNIDTKYAMFFAGGLTVTDPVTSAPIQISEIGDILGMAASSAVNFGPWQSFAGIRRGLIGNALSVVNNFGTPGNTALLDLLCNRGINVVVNSNRRMKLNSSYTGQISESQFSFGSVTRLILYYKKTMGPILENWLEEPNDIPTWKGIYQQVKPFHEQLKAKRAIHSYDWQGDQNARSMDDLTTNVPADVDQGKYRVNVFLKAIVPLIDIQISIILTPSGVSFEEALEQIQPSA
jgi:hypothetical protein